MSSVNQIFSKPGSIVFAPPLQTQSAAPMLKKRNGAQSNKASTDLIVKGQGVLFGSLQNNVDAFSYVIYHSQTHDKNNNDLPNPI